ncbi:hypothetical protein Agub_g539, partial [Astrephomene gubernaculifera]
NQQPAAECGSVALRVSESGMPEPLRLAAVPDAIARLLAAARERMLGMTDELLHLRAFLRFSLPPPPPHQLTRITAPLPPAPVGAARSAATAAPPGQSAGDDATGSLATLPHRLSATQLEEGGLAAAPATGVEGTAARGAEGGAPSARLLISGQWQHKRHVLLLLAQLRQVERMAAEVGAQLDAAERDAGAVRTALQQRANELQLLTSAKAEELAAAQAEQQQLEASLGQLEQEAQAVDDYLARCHAASEAAQELERVLEQQLTEAEARHQRAVAAVAEAAEREQAMKAHQALVAQHTAAAADAVRLQPHPGLAQAQGAERQGRERLLTAQRRLSEALQLKAALTAHWRDTQAAAGAGLRGAAQRRHAARVEEAQRQVVEATKVVALAEMEVQELLVTVESLSRATHEAEDAASKAQAAAAATASAQAAAAAEQLATAAREARAAEEEQQNAREAVAALQVQLHGLRSSGEADLTAAAAQQQGVLVEPMRARRQQLRAELEACGERAEAAHRELQGALAATSALSQHVEDAERSYREQLLRLQVSCPQLEESATQLRTRLAAYPAELVRQLKRLVEQSDVEAYQDDSGRWTLRNLPPEWERAIRPGLLAAAAVSSEDSGSLCGSGSSSPHGAAPHPDSPPQQEGSQGQNASGSNTVGAGMGRLQAGPMEPAGVRGGVTAPQDVPPDGSGAVAGQAVSCAGAATGECQSSSLHNMSVAQLARMARCALGPGANPALTAVQGSGNVVVAHCVVLAGDTVLPQTVAQHDGSTGISSGAVAQSSAERLPSPCSGENCQSPHSASGPAERCKDNHRTSPGTRNSSYVRTSPVLHRRRIVRSPRPPGGSHRKDAADVSSVAMPSPCDALGGGGASEVARSGESPSALGPELHAVQSHHLPSCTDSSGGEPSQPMAAGEPSLRALDARGGGSLGPTRHPDQPALAPSHSPLRLFETVLGRWVGSSSHQAYWSSSGSTASLSKSGSNDMPAGLEDGQAGNHSVPRPHAKQRLASKHSASKHSALPQPVPCTQRYAPPSSLPQPAGACARGHGAVLPGRPSQSVSASNESGNSGALGSGQQLVTQSGASAGHTAGAAHAMKGSRLQPALGRSGAFAVRNMDDAVCVFHLRMLGRRALHALRKYVNQLAIFTTRLQHIAREQRLRWALSQLRAGVSEPRARAQALAESNALFRCYARWRWFLQVQRRRRRVVLLVLQRRRERLLRGCLQWWAEWRDAQELKQQADTCARLQRLRWLVRRWRQGAWMLADARQRKAVADCVYSRGLLARCFGRWRRQLRARRVLHNVFTRAELMWEEYADELRSLGNEFSMLRRAFDQLLRYTSHRLSKRQERINEQAALAFRSSLLRVRAFTAWQAAVTAAWQERYVARMATRALRAWRRTAHTQRELPRSLCSLRRRLRARGFAAGEVDVRRQWLMRSALAALASVFATPRRHYTHSLLRRAMRAFEEVMSRQVGLVSAHRSRWQLEHRRRTLLLSWQAAAADRACKRQVVTVAEARRRRRMLQSCVDAWRAFFRLSREKNNLAATAALHYGCTVTRRVLRQLAAYASRIWKAAAMHHAARQLRRCLEAWLALAVSVRAQREALRRTLVGADNCSLLLQEQQPPKQGGAYRRQQGLMGDQRQRHAGAPQAVTGALLPSSSPPAPAALVPCEPSRRLRADCAVTAAPAGLGHCERVLRPVSSGSTTASEAAAPTRYFEYRTQDPHGGADSVVQVLALEPRDGRHGSECAIGDEYGAQEVQSCALPWRVGMLGRGSTLQSERGGAEQDGIRDCGPMQGPRCTTPSEIGEPEDLLPANVENSCSLASSRIAAYGLPDDLSSMDAATRQLWRSYAQHQLAAEWYRRRVLQRVLSAFRGLALRARGARGGHLAGSAGPLRARRIRRK